VTVAEHELLLRATLGPDDEALDAYERWRAEVDLATVDRASQRVLALLAERLGDRRDDAVAEKVHRIARFTWLRTQVLLERSAPAVRALTESGIPVLLIKGAAVLAHTGWQVARRPMDDLDIAVPRALAAPAVEMLRACDFVPPYRPTRAHLDERHALGFRHPSGAEVDLHWHTLHASLHHDADAAFWAAAQPARLRDVDCLVLCREDALLQAVVQGREHTETHPLRWAADAAELLRGATDFDWDRVLEQARRHRVGRELREGLDVLAELGVVPEDVRAEGAARRAAGGRARRADEAAGHGPLAPSPRARISDELTGWVRREVAPGARLGPRHAALYLKETWALPRARSIPRHALWLACGRRAGAPEDRPPAAAVPLTDSLRFQLGESGTANLGEGWWAPDTYGAWTRGREAVLVLPLDAPHDAPLRLTLEVTPFLATTRPYLEVGVSVDGERHATWGFSGVAGIAEQRPLDVPARANRERIALRFAVRHPLSPLAARYGSDPRPLGFALRSVSRG
jgi:hypothetical protein